MCKYIFVSLLIKNPSVTIPEFHLLLYITLYILQIWINWQGAIYWVVGLKYIIVKKPE